MSYLDCRGRFSRVSNARRQCKQVTVGSCPPSLLPTPLLYLQHEDAVDVREERVEVLRKEAARLGTRSLRGEASGGAAPQREVPEARADRSGHCVVPRVHARVRVGEGCSERVEGR